MQCTHANLILCPQTQRKQTDPFLLEHQDKIENSDLPKYAPLNAIMFSGYTSIRMSVRLSICPILVTVTSWE